MTYAKLLAGLSVLAVSACGKLPGFVVGQKSDSFAQGAVKNDKIDVLFVVDNSGSMAEEQTVLGDSFSGFIHAFAEKNLDFHIAVISTDMLNNNAWWASTHISGIKPYLNFPNAGVGSILARTGNDRYITKNSVNYATQFKQNVNLGTDGNGGEVGLLSIMKALDSSMTGAGQFNEGFLRSDAYLGVIVVSDEDEGDTPNTGDYVKKYPTMRDQRVTDFSNFFKALKGGRTDLLRFDAVVARTVAECPTVYTPAGNSAGTGDVYMEVAAAFKGKSANICQDFSAAISDVGDGLVAMLRRFKLLQPPASAIDVFVNGVYQFQGIHWEYDADRQEVVFAEGHVPAQGAKIETYYVPAKPL